MNVIARRFEPQRSLLDDPERLLKLYGISVNERVGLVNEIDALRHQHEGAVSALEQIVALSDNVRTESDDHEAFRRAADIARTAIGWQ